MGVLIYTSFTSLSHYNYLPTTTLLINSFESPLKYPGIFLFSSNPIPDWAGSFHVFSPSALYTSYPSFQLPFAFLSLLPGSQLYEGDVPLIPVILCPSIQHRICGRFFPPGLQNHCWWWVQPRNLKRLAPWKKSYDQPVLSHSVISDSLHPYGL